MNLNDNVFERGKFVEKSNKTFAINISHPRIIFNFQGYFQSETLSHIGHNMQQNL